MDILSQITNERRAAVAAAKRNVPVSALEEQARGRMHHSLCERLDATSGGTRILAEIKRASPSAGMIRPDFRPADIARTYEQAGAVGISVLTEPEHFLGHEAHLRRVRQAVGLPVLRKDFMVDPYQIAEAAAWGADVILLIVAALEPGLMRELYDAAVAHGLEVLVEAHTADELHLALQLECAMIGVNSRNLKTLTTDLAVAIELAARIPPHRLAIAESGIRTRTDIEQLEAAGYRGFLIGEALMKEGDPGRKLTKLLDQADGSM